MQKLSLHEPKFNGNELKYLKKCIKSTWVSTSGEFVDKFEKKIAKYTNSKYAIACNSGTSALHISLLIAGVKSDDEVIVPTLTFIAPINTVKYVNATPIFMDSDQYFNIDIKKTIEFINNETFFKNGFTINKSSKKIIKALVVVHVFGNAINLAEIHKLCKKKNIRLIEDCSESLGTFYKNKRKKIHTGNYGDLSCVSFNGNKIITSGAGGMILTNIKSYEKKIRYLIKQAKDDQLNFVHNEIGFNYSLTNIHAAIGYAQFENLKFILNKKKLIHKQYISLLKENDNFSICETPKYSKNNNWLNILKIKNLKKNNKKKLISKFIKNKIFVRPIWKLNHLQKQFINCQRYKIKNASILLANSVCLPSSHHLSNSDIKRIMKVISE